MSEYLSLCQLFNSINDCKRLWDKFGFSFEIMDLNLKKILIN